jgi:hypothetical protein
MHVVEQLQEQGVYREAEISNASPDFDIEPDQDLTSFDEDKVRLTKYFGLVPRHLLDEAMKESDDEEVIEFDDEDDSYVRRGDKDSGYNKRGGGGGHYEKRDYRGGDSRGGSRGGGYNNKDTWRDNRGYYDRNQDGDSRSKPSGGYDKNRGGADDNSQAENEERVVYVSNLNYQTDENGLKKAFKEFGFIERVHLNCRRGDGKSLGNAQV